MKLVYIAWPIDDRGIYISALCRDIRRYRPDVFPISPAHAVSWMSLKKEKNNVLGFCLELLRRCDEVWVFKDSRRSVAAAKEIVAAVEDKYGISKEDQFFYLTQITPIARTGSHEKACLKEQEGRT